METTFISIIDEKGKLVKEGIVKISSDEIDKFLKKQKLSYEKIGIESAQISINLARAYQKKICKCMTRCSLDSSSYSC